jgi:hypothetical protein
MTASYGATYPPELLTTLDGLTTEAVNPALADIDTRATTDLVGLMIDGDRAFPMPSPPALPRSAPPSTASPPGCGVVVD